MLFCQTISGDDKLLKYFSRLLQNFFFSRKKLWKAWAPQVLSMLMNSKKERPHYAWRTAIKIFSCDPNFAWTFLKLFLSLCNYQFAPIIFLYIFFFGLLRIVPKLWLMTDRMWEWRRRKASLMLKMLEWKLKIVFHWTGRGERERERERDENSLWLMLFLCLLREEKKDLNYPRKLEKEFGQISWSGWTFFSFEWN